MTFDYLKQRKQFGKLIGEFQALQHRAAHLYGEIEIARAAALKAAQLLDAGDRARRADGLGRQGQGGARSPALAVQEGVQMHGGIGMTDEHDIGLYMKREAVLSELFGEPRFHANEVARAQRLLRSALQQEVDPRGGDRLGAVLLPGIGLDIGDALAEPLDQRRRRRCRRALGPPRM